LGKAAYIKAFRAEDLDSFRACDGNCEA